MSARVAPAPYVAIRLGVVLSTQHRAQLGDIAALYGLSLTAAVRAVIEDRHAAIFPPRKKAPRAATHAKAGAK